MTGSHPYRRENAPPGPPAPYQQTHSSRPSCKICSYTQPHPEIKVPLYHQHFSSIRLRGLIGVEESNAAYLCPSCKSRHTPYPENRTKIVISDSTLHNFFAPPGHTSTQYEGDWQHVDYITIPGSCLETLFHAFKLDYEAHPRPLDVVVVAGYNDLLEQHSRDFIVAIIKRFARYVIQLGIQTHPDTPNTVAIASFMYPPQLSWFRDNGPEPPQFHNQKDKLDWINGQIDDLNIANGCPEYPGFHKYGMRMVTRKYTDKYGQEHHRVIKKHRWEHWRESERSQKLHLTNERRFKMGKAVNEYFIIRT